MVTISIDNDQNGHYTSPHRRTTRHGRDSMWTKVEKAHGEAGRPPGVGVGIAAQRNGFNITIPAHLLSNSRADIFRDGTKIAIRQSDEGLFSIFGNSKRSRARVVRPPVTIQREFPGLASGPIPHTIDDGMIVIDLADAPRKAVSA
jgi:hypothetical protein